MFTENKTINNAFDIIMAARHRLVTSLALFD